MKIEIPFDENIYRQQMLFIFDEIYDKHLHTNKINFYYGLLFLFVALVSYLQLNKDSILPISGLLLGLIFIGLSLSYYKSYRSKKKAYLSLIEEEVQEHIVANQTCVLEVNDDFLRWKNFKLDFKLNWQAIKSCRLINDNLILGLAPNTSLIIISKAEIKNENFNELVHILSQKKLLQSSN